MTKKEHGLILFSIIALMFLAWQTVQMLNRPKQVAEVISPYKVEVVSASYGLSCAQFISEEPAGPRPSSAFPLTKNNALKKVAAACNGKMKCGFRLSEDYFGKDPAPNCGGKELVVEYRCFALDRLWTSKTPSRADFALDCTRE